MKGMVEKLEFNPLKEGAEVKFSLWSGPRSLAVSVRFWDEVL